jgi:NAD(P)-dependent dehydrogenase (short-subunit alcohol dehydrogenase family)
MGILEGKVVLVTGGGRGIGRDCALLAAREGAKVVVGDYGGSAAGGDGDAGPAEQVAAEIRAAGGAAVSNAGSVTDMKAVREMVTQALDMFGGLHSVINPAGFLRDTMFHKMEDKDWHEVVEVHLHGSYNVTRATVEHFRNQNDGSYVLFASTVGLIGNIGQANYSAGKMGIVGLSRSLAIEGAIKNVRSNVIAPYAFTRLIGTIKPKDEEQAAKLAKMERTMRSDQVATLAIALAVDPNTNGQIFIARGNEVTLLSQPRAIRQIADSSGWTPERLIEQGLTAMRSSYYPPQHVDLFPYDPI